MPFDPEFIPGAIRAELDELDRAIATVEFAILNGPWTDLNQLRETRGYRRGLIAAREMKVKRIDEETKQRLGLVP